MNEYIDTQVHKLRQEFKQWAGKKDDEMEGLEHQLQETWDDYLD